MPILMAPGYHSDYHRFPHHILAESLVEKWLNREGYSTVFGVRRTGLTFRPNPFSGHNEAMGMEGLCQKPSVLGSS